VRLAEEEEALEGAQDGAAVLQRMLDELDEPEEAPWWSPQPVAATEVGNGAPTRMPVIMPGSVGLDLLHDNREYFVERVFYSPLNQQVSYSGFHDRTRYGVAEQRPVTAVAPLEGESKLGEYDLATGELIGPESGADDEE
jgi:hypothetical protein